MNLLHYLLYFRHLVYWTSWLPPLHSDQLRPSASVSPVVLGDQEEATYLAIAWPATETACEEDIGFPRVEILKY